MNVSVTRQQVMERLEKAMRENNSENIKYCKIVLEYMNQHATNTIEIMDTSK